MPWSVSDAELEQAYAEADRPWLEMPLGQALGLDWDDEFDDGRGPDERDRAAMDSASAYELVARLQDVPSPESRRSRTITDALNLLRAVDRLSSWAASRQAFLLAEVFDQIRSLGGTRRGEPGNGAVDPQLIVTLAAQEIAPLLRVPGRTAQRMLGDAVRLTEELPGTWKALEEGRVSPVQAQVLVEESGSLPAEALPRFEEAVLDAAGGLTRPKLARRCRRVREELHPETITARKVRAVQERCVTVQPEQDGMAWLGAYLPAEQAHGIFNRVDASARSLQGPTEPRTLSQLRADVFADVLTHTCEGDVRKGTGFRGIGASVFVTVPVMTLLGHKRSDWQNLPTDTTDTTDTTDHGTGAGLDGRAGPGVDGIGGRLSVLTDSATAGAEGGAGSGTGTGVGGGKGFGGNSADAGAAADAGPGVPDVSGCENGLLDGYGPIDPDTARSLAAHAPSFTRILVHPETGAVLSVGRDRYRPPKHLQDWVRITHPTCMHPGCNRSSWTCEIDHLTPWAHGGHTALGNLGPKCKLHHMMKTEGIWPAGTDERGDPYITSLGGKTYTTLPEPPPPF